MSQPEQLPFRRTPVPVTEVAALAEQAVTECEALEQKLRDIGKKITFRGFVPLIPASSDAITAANQVRCAMLFAREALDLLRTIEKQETEEEQKS